MERAHLQPAGIVAAHQADDALAHLLGGLVGEREGEDGPGGKPQLKQMGYLIGQHTGLSRAGSSHHQLRAINIFNSGQLAVVEFFL